MNKLRLRKAVSEQDGQALIEMGVVLPLFFVCVMGIFEFSLMMFSYCSANYAAREAARYASVHSNTSLSPASVNSITAVVNANLWLHSTATPNITVCWGSSGCGTSTQNLVQNRVEVEITWSNPAFLQLSSVSLGTQAYRIITQ